jgi:Ca2+-binding RTX toxin-like protein
MESRGWTTVDSGNAMGGRVQTKEMPDGQYRLELTVHDRTDDGRSLVLGVDNVTMYRYEHEKFVAAAGTVDVVTRAEDLDVALQGGRSAIYLLPVGGDVVDAGAGDDILFGDALNTDHLSWSGHAAGTHDGMGMQALRETLAETVGRTPTGSDIYDYIAAHAEELAGVGDARGGNDAIDGGSGNDRIYAQGGDDIVKGGQGSDRLSGGMGNDTFVWKAGDQGSVAAPAIDRVTDFSIRGAHGTDKLDLRGLLIDLDQDGDLTRYLNILARPGEDGSTDTVINVNTRGQVAAGVDQQIVLLGIDLVNGQGNQAQLFKDLVDQGTVQLYN